MIVVTGGAGFIGSNLVRALNAAGHDNIMVVDDLREGDKFRNLADCRVGDYLDRNEFRERVRAGTRIPGLSHVFHQGACTDTLERDGQIMLDNNYRYSRELLDYCLERQVPFIYASSASVYGVGRRFVETAETEWPVNVYGYSKKLFDDHVRHIAGGGSQVAGMRYFNVYGPGEAHKGRMASVAHHLNQQLLHGAKLKLFKGSGGFGDGEQRRDFVHVDDVVKVNLWFMAHPQVSGIFNVGTGRSRTFNELAARVADWHGTAAGIEYIDFPEHLAAHYQHYTEADVGRLRAAGYRDPFLDLEQGVKSYLDRVNARLPTGASRAG